MSRVPDPLDLSQQPDQLATGTWTHLIVVHPWKPIPERARPHAEAATGR